VPHASSQLCVVHQGHHIVTALWPGAILQVLLSPCARSLCHMSDSTCSHPCDITEWVCFLSRLRRVGLVTKTLPCIRSSQGGNTRGVQMTVPGILLICHGWLVAGGDLVVHGRISIIGQGSLRIEGLESSDSGNYMCTATNGQGKPVKVGAKVTILGKWLVSSWMYVFVFCKMLGYLKPTADVCDISLLRWNIWYVAAGQ